MSGNRSTTSFFIFTLFSVSILTSCASRSDVSNLRIAAFENEQRIKKLEDQNQEFASLKDDSFSGIRAALIELNARIGSLEESNASMRGDFARLQSSVQDTAARMQSDLLKMSELAAQMQSASERSSDYQQEYQATQKALADLQTQFGRRLRELEISVEEIAATTDALAQPAASED